MNLQTLINIFKNNNKQLYKVGGCVRDEFMGLKPKDIDLTTDTIPDEIKKLLEQNNFQVIPLGEKFGTIATYIDNIQVEITTFRKEVYNIDSRKPEVSFSKNIEDDLKRRDFTINTIAVNLITNEVIDPFNGCNDILLRRICTPVDANITFKEDPLRILRCARFITRGFIPSSEVLIAAKKQHKRLEIVSDERITEELNKILTAPKGISTVAALLFLKDNKILPLIFPELVDLYNLPQNNKYHMKDVWTHTLLVIQNTRNDARLRWAALFHDIGKPKAFEIHEDGIHFYQHEKDGEIIWRQIASRLKGLDKKFISDVAFLIRNHMRLQNCKTSKSIKRTLFKCNEQGERIFNLLLELSEADCTSGKYMKKEEVRKSIDEIRKVVFNIKEDKPKLPKGLGLILIEKFNKPPGKWINEEKEKLYELIVSGKLNINPTIKECLSQLK